MNITLDVSPKLEEQLQQAARMQGTDVNTYLLDSARLRLWPDVLPKAEASLLLTINAPLAPEARFKRDALLAEQARRQLTEEEQDTLTGLVDGVEMANAQRWQALAALARLRGLSLAETINSLPSEVRPNSQFGAGCHPLEGVDIEALLATPIDDMFADYMPDDAEESKQ